MAGVDGGNAKRLGQGLASLLVSLAGIIIVAAPTVHAQELQAVICKEPANLILTQPTNDSVVRDQAVPISGTVRQATQLEIYVDTMLDKVIPIGAGDTTFSTTVQLTEGTHTLRVVAVDICQIGNGEASAVVTHQPLVTQGSSGANVPTTISGVRTGIIQNGSTPAPSWPPSSVSDILAKVTDFFDIDAAPAETTPQLPQVARFGLFTTGALVVMFSQLLSAAGVTSKFALVASHWIGLHSAIGPRLVISGIGAVVIILAFVL